MRVRGLLTATLIGAAMSAAVAASAATTDIPGAQQSQQSRTLPGGSYKVAQACGYWAIFGCSRNFAATQATVNQYGGGCVMNTDDCDNFAGGFYCAVTGPKTKQAADITASRLRQSMTPQAYVKYACCPSSC